MERWRQPVIPVALEDDLDTRWHDGERLRSNVAVTLSEADTQRIREGRVCLRCYEPHETSFPVNCTLCGYEMKARQLEDFGKEYAGTKHVGPHKTLKEELELLEIQRRTGIHVPKPSIIVPRSISASS